MKKEENKERAGDSIRKGRRVGVRFWVFEPKGSRRLRLRTKERDHQELSERVRRRRSEGARGGGSGGHLSVKRRDPAPQKAAPRAHLENKGIRCSGPIIIQRRGPVPSGVRRSKFAAPRAAPRQFGRALDDPLFLLYISPATATFLSFSAASPSQFPPALIGFT